MGVTHFGADTGSYTQNEIVDYETEDGAKIPMLVVHKNDQEGGDGTVVGLAFHPDGHTETVTFVTGQDANAPTPPDPQDAWNNLSDAQRARILSQQTPPTPPQSENPPAPANPSGGSA